MNGRFIDTYRKRIFKGEPQLSEKMVLLPTSYGNIRAFDSGGNKTVILNFPDGPNVIEHHLHLIERLSKNYRVICFEFPGVGFSMPTKAFDYSIDSAAQLIREVVRSLSVERLAILASCSNGFYAIRFAEQYPDMVEHLFLAQTPSLTSMMLWSDSSIPRMLTLPIIGQLMNSVNEKRLAEIWYKIALPKTTDKSTYSNTAHDVISKGGCFCLSSLVQGLMKEESRALSLNGVQTLLIWGGMDYSHRKTDFHTIKEHIPNCEMLEFPECGHFPELENTKDFVQLINEKLL